MFGAEIIDVAIGVVFVFLLVSVVCSAIREGIEAWLKTRAAYLERGIRELLHDRGGRGLAKSFYENPLIYSLYSHEYVPGKKKGRPSALESGKTLPSYIPASSFALALMDIAARGPSPMAGTSSNAPLLSLDSMRANISNVGNERVQRALLTAIDSAQGDLDRAQKNIEAWYDSSMDRVSGWYKRSTQKVLFVIGLTVAILLNINTITIADYLYRDDTAREAFVAHIDADSARREYTYADAVRQLNTLNLPILWPRDLSFPHMFGKNSPGTDRPILTWHFYTWFGTSLPGWLLTALAATMGAPVWFDLLNKLMVIRSTVKPKEKSPEEGSEDRQAKPSPTLAMSGGPRAPARAILHIPAPMSFKVEEGCDVPVTRVTLDEDLPVAEGGVAQQ